MEENRLDIRTVNVCVDEIPGGGARVNFMLVSTGHQSRSRWTYGREVGTEMVLTILQEAPSYRAAPADERPDDAAIVAEAAARLREDLLKIAARLVDPRIEDLDGKYEVINVLAGEGPEPGRAATRDRQMVVEEQNAQVACHLPPPEGDPAEWRCSFCGRSGDGNRRLIGGQTASVYICAECVAPCRAVLDDERAADSTG
jgi:hypothetical protein